MRGGRLTRLMFCINGAHEAWSRQINHYNASLVIMIVGQVPGASTMALSLARQMNLLGSHLVEIPSV